MAASQIKFDLKDYFGQKSTQQGDTMETNQGRENYNTYPEPTKKRTHSELSTPSPTVKHPEKKAYKNITEGGSDSDSEHTYSFLSSPSPMSFIDQKYTDIIIESLKKEPVLHLLEGLVEQAVKKRTHTLESHVSYLMGCIDSLTVRVHELELEKLKEQTQIHDKLDEQEQYSRRTSLRVINNWKEDKSEDTDDKILDLVNNNLELNIKKEDIDRSHRVGPRKKNGSPRPIIVKFVSHHTKSQVYKCRGKLRLGGEPTKGIYVNEDLTKKRLKMFKAALSLKKDNSIQDCWTTDGKIFVRDAKAQIKVFLDLVSFEKWKTDIQKNPPQTYAEILKS